MKTAILAALVWLPLTLGATAPAKITVYLQGAKATDSLTLVWWEKTIGGYMHELAMGDHYAPAIKQCAHMDKEGKFVFEVAVPTDAVYFSLYEDVDNQFREPLWLLQSYLLEGSDDVRIGIQQGPTVNLDGTGLGVQRYLFNLANRTLTFTGPGSGKYACKYVIDTACPAIYLRMASSFPFSEEGKYVPHNQMEALQDYALEVIDSMKGALSGPAYNLLKIDYEALFRGTILQDMRRAVDVAATEQSFKGFTPRQADSARLVCLGNLSRVFIDQFLTDAVFTPFSEEMETRSDIYSAYLLERTLTLKYIGYPNDRHTGVLDLLKARYTGDIRDKAITLYLVTEFRTIPDRDGVLKDALASVSTPYYQQRLRELENTSGTGNAAYDFQLPDIRGNLVHLSDFKGKVVFIDFWFTGCGACMGFYKYQLSKVEQAFKGNPDVVFVTVCVDAQKATWKQSLESGAYTSPDIVNLYTGGRGSSDPVVDGFHVTAYPHPFLIDRQGRIFNTNMQVLSDQIIQSIKEALAKN